MAVFRSAGRRACRPTSLGSGHNQSAIDIDRLAGDISGVVAGEEGDQAGDIFAGSGALHRDAFDPFLHQFTGGVVAEQLAPGLVVIGPHVGFDDAGAEGVDGNLFDRDFLRQALGDADDAHFRGGVVRGVDEAVAGLAGGGVDDAAAALVLAHSGNGLLGAEEDALGVNGHDLVPFVFGHVLDAGDGDDAGILDRDIDRPEFLFGGIVERFDARLVCDIADEGDRLAALGPDRFGNAVDQILVRRDDEIGALARKAPCDGGADAAAGPGDDDSLVFEAFHALSFRVSVEGRKFGSMNSRCL
ncbi:hypothetical protein RHECNPAF_6420040 [Rhizobium etli CNPAF512]|nr:hypothetical protein RHECNPAF_6420040 [Rhizobium etli CNPAF512]